MMRAFLLNLSFQKRVTWMEATTQSQWVESSNQSTPRPPMNQHPDYLAYQDFVDSICWAITFISMIALLSNALVFVLIGLNKTLQTTTNALVASLSAADLLYSAVMVPNYLASLSRAIEPACFIDSIFPTVCSLASVWSLFAISTDRYLTVRLPLKYRFYIGTKAIIGEVVYIWTVSILITAILFIPTPESLQIGILRCHHALHPTVGFFIVYVIFMLIPLLGTIIVYCQIITIARRATKRDLKEKESIAARPSVEPEPSNPAAFHRKASFPRISIRVAKSTRQFFSIAIIFMVVWIPMIALTLAYAFCNPCRGNRVIMYSQKVVELLYAVAVLANPWIYTLRTLDFRLALRRLCCGWKCCLQRRPSVASFASASQIT